MRVHGAKGKLGSSIPQRGCSVVPGQHNANEQRNDATERAWPTYGEVVPKMHFLRPPPRTTPQLVPDLWRPHQLCHRLTQAVVPCRRVLHQRYYQQHCLASVPHMLGGLYEEQTSCVEHETACELLTAPNNNPINNTHCSANAEDSWLRRASSAHIDDKSSTRMQPDTKPRAVRLGEHLLLARANVQPTRIPRCMQRIVTAMPITDSPPMIRPSTTDRHCAHVAPTVAQDRTTTKWEQGKQRRRQQVRTQRRSRTRCTN